MHTYMCAHVYTYIHVCMYKNTYMREKVGEERLAKACCLARGKPSVKVSYHFPGEKWGGQGLLNRRHGAEA